MTEDKTPMQIVTERIVDLEAAVYALPFRGNDQRWRARDGIEALRNHLHACQLEEPHRWH